MKIFRIRKIRPLHLFLAISILTIIGNLVFKTFVIANQEEKIFGLEDRAVVLKASISGRGDSPLVAKARMVNFVNSLPIQNELATALGRVLDTARKSNLNVPAGDYSVEPVKDSRFSKYTFTLPVEGRYGSVKKFIYEMETSDMPIAIEELTLAKGKSGSGQLSLNIKISVLYK